MSIEQRKEWSVSARYFTLVGIIFALIGVIWYFKAIVNPVIVAGLLAYVFYPLVRFLNERTRLSHRSVVIIVYIVGLLLLAAAPAIVTPVIVNQVRSLTIDLESLFAHYDELLNTPIHVLGSLFYPRQFLPDVPKISTDLLTPLAENIIVLFGAVTKNFLWVFVVLISWYYFLQDGHRLPGMILKLTPEIYLPDVRRIMEQIRFIWADYMRSQLTFMLAVGVMDTAAWLIIGLPGAVFLGFFTGLTSFVHEIGAIVSGVLSVLVALLEGSNYFSISNFWFAVLVLGVYMILTAIKNIWLRPIIVGRTVHIHPGIVFVAIIGALMLHGALAAFLAVPFLLSLVVLGKYLWRRVLGLPPFPEDDPLTAAEGDSTSISQP